ncbi:CPBP family glutamic-type intramembrane protease [Methanolobus sp. WCC4]|uniref:CPBP family glutamic-type intramembrane protease n=1 Tax=Methanolobus sp. WCC4 TaxID=3125784 RepID=UPI0030FBD69C
MSITSYYREVFSLKRLDRVSIAAFLVVGMLFFLVSADHLWHDDSITMMFMVYFLMMSFSFSVLDQKNPLYDISLLDGLIQWGVGFVAGLFIFSEFGISGSSNLAGFGTLGLLIIAETIIGLNEELTFRGAIVKAFQTGKMKMTEGNARLFSAIAFSLFHVWVSDFNITFLITAFFFALAMQYIWDKGYPLASAGLHTSWNVVVIAGSLTILGVI